MKCKQLADCSISINRFDTQETITFDLDTIIDVDKDTANYLLNMKVYDENKNLLSNFVLVD